MRIAILGIGSIGRRHLANLNALGHREVVVYDQDGAQIERARDDPGVSFVGHTTELASLWKARPEVVLICTPPDSHVALADQALDHGAKGLFIEKPLALRLPPFDPYRVGEQDFESSRWDAKATTMVGANLRFHPGPMALKRWLDEGRVGQVLGGRFWGESDLRGWHGAGWRYQDSYVARTGAVLDCGAHEVDLARWLLGDALLCARSIRDAGSIGLPEVDGLADLMLRHDSGAVSTVHVDFVSRNYRRGIVLIGTEATASWAWNGRYSLVGLMRENAVLDGENGPTDRDHAIHDMYLAELRHFMDCVAEGRQTCNPVGEAVKTQRILEAALQTWRGRQVADAAA